MTGTMGTFLQRILFGLEPLVRCSKSWTYSEWIKDNPGVTAQYTRFPSCSFAGSDGFGMILPQGVKGAIQFVLSFLSFGVFWKS